MALSEQTLMSYLADRYLETLRPIAGLIELTYRCNLRCTHCYVPGYDEPCATELNEVEVRRVVDEMMDLGILRIVLSGGEPMVHHSWREVVHYIKEKGFLLTVFSNATMIDPGAASALNDAGVDMVEVSLYGSSSEVYETVTAMPGSFESFRRGLQCLRNANVPIALKPIVLRQNVDDYESMIQFAETNGYFLRLRYSPCLISVPSSPRTCRDCRLTDEQMTRLLLSSGSCGPFEAETCNPCRIGARGLVVGPYGDVRACVVHPVRAGNIRNQSLKSVWEHSPLFRELRRLSDEDFASCLSCDLRPYCQPCIALNVVETGHITAPSPENCRIARNRQAASKQMLTGKSEKEEVSFVAEGSCDWQQ